jgi:hypothetical protein
MEAPEVERPVIGVLQLQLVLAQQIKVTQEVQQVQILFSVPVVAVERVLLVKIQLMTMEETVDQVLAQVLLEVL